VSPTYDPVRLLGWTGCYTPVGTVRDTYAVRRRLEVSRRGCVGDMNGCQNFDGTRFLFVQ